MKHDPKATANAAAVTVAIVFIVCRVGVALFPDLAMTIAQSWFHGIQLTQISLFSNRQKGFHLFPFHMSEDQVLAIKIQ